MSTEAKDDPKVPGRKISKNLSRTKLEKKPS